MKSPQLIRQLQSNPPAIVMAFVTSLVMLLAVAPMAHADEVPEVQPMAACYTVLTERNVVHYKPSSACSDVNINGVHAWGFQTFVDVRGQYLSNGTWVNGKAGPFRYWRFVDPGAQKVLISSLLPGSAYQLKASNGVEFELRV